MRGSSFATLPTLAFLPAAAKRLRRLGRGLLAALIALEVDRRRDERNRPEDRGDDDRLPGGRPG